MHGKTVENINNKTFVDAVVRWKSPITGTVTVSGSVQPVDSNVVFSGLAWQFAKGQAILASGETKEDNLTSFGPAEISVIAGEYLNLEVGRAQLTSGYYGSTAATLTVTLP